MQVASLQHALNVSSGGVVHVARVGAEQEGRAATRHGHLRGNLPSWRTSALQPAQAVTSFNRQGRELNSVHQNGALLPTQKRKTSPGCVRQSRATEPSPESRSKKGSGPSSPGAACASPLSPPPDGAQLPRPRCWWRPVVVVAALLLVVWGRGTPALAAEGAGKETAAGAAFNFGAFGLSGSLSDRTPGLAYFALLMAAGCGLFVSEEALNVWVGGSLGRCLVIGGTREALMQSLHANGAYIASVIFWVYWGVCLSDLIPFYAGQWAAKRGESITHKLGGTNQATLARVTATVRKYGRLIGFVERFSLGVRNPTAFLAGFSGVSAATFFSGVCAGGLLTLPLQMGLGFALRDRPVSALATVAVIVGAWTVIPYASAALAAAGFLVKQRLDKRGEAAAGNSQS